MLNYRRQVRKHKINKNDVWKICERCEFLQYNFGIAKSEEWVIFEKYLGSGGIKPGKGDSDNWV